MVVGGGDDWADAGQMRRMSDGRKHLRRAYIGAGKHADSAVGAGECSGPLDCVVAVGAFVLKGVPLPFGIESAAGVLGDNDKAPLGGLHSYGGHVVLVVGRAGEQDRVFLAVGGPVDVGDERDSVAGLHGHVPLKGDARNGLGDERDGKG